MNDKNMPRIVWQNQEVDKREFMPVAEGRALEIRRTARRIEVLKCELAAEEQWLALLNEEETVHAAHMEGAA